MLDLWYCRGQVNGTLQQRVVRIMKRVAIHFMTLFTVPNSLACSTVHVSGRIQFHRPHTVSWTFCWLPSSRHSAEQGETIGQSDVHSDIACGLQCCVHFPHQMVLTTTAIVHGKFTDPHICQPSHPTLTAKNWSEFIDYMQEYLYRVYYTCRACKRCFTR